MSLPLFIRVFLLQGAEAHVPETIVVGPTADWCQAVRTLAAPADRVVLLPGRYPGGCELDVGGLVDLNEALLVTRGGPEPVIIEADEEGISLRITGEPTRIYDLTLLGRVEAVANNVTIDTCEVSEIHVAPGVDRSTIVWNTVDAPFQVESVNAVIRGNRVPSLSVSAEAGLVADNAVDVDVFSTVPTHRNFVGGALTVEHDAFANVVIGPAVVEGALYGNTLLGHASAADARNNLTLHAELPIAEGNLRCADFGSTSSAWICDPQGPQQARVHGSKPREIARDSACKPGLLSERWGCSNTSTGRSGPSTTASERGACKRARRRRPFRLHRCQWSPRVSRRARSSSRPDAPAVPGPLQARFSRLSSRVASIGTCGGI